MKPLWLIVTAAGSGTRMGAAVPKQFLFLEGKAILQRTIERFVEAVPGVKVVTVLPKEHIPYWKKYCLERSFTIPQVIVAGGITRFHSVRNALERVPDGAVVAVHDGVRPFVSAALVRSMAETMQSCRALVPVLPSTDTLKALSAGPDGVLATIPGRVLDRSEVYGAQTPQMFLSEELKAAYSQAFDTSFTDDASVAERCGIPLSWCEGERLNIKITRPEDLLLARAILSL
ncbi:MAG: 2-C-methyl-D-erythritol 4-phosphate cytidylyltransferase [Bacteroidales bacterium]|nr:2-C-methyl-D-erythritol 4-phosphate cytidylyltransferase [Bacteroidales bacterium]